MFTLTAGVVSHILGTVMAVSLTVMAPYRILLGAPDANGTLSPSEMLESLKASLTKANDHNKKVHAMLNKAKKKKNVMLVSCIEPKAKDIAFWTKELGTTVNEFTSARKTETRERLSFIFQKGVTISGKIENLFVEATRCVGDEHFITAGGKGVRLQVVGPDYVLNPTESVVVGTVQDSMDNPSLDNDLSGSDVSETSPEVSDWAGDVVWPEATQFE